MSPPVIHICHKKMRFWVNDNFLRGLFVAFIGKILSNKFYLKKTTLILFLFFWLFLYKGIWTKVVYPNYFFWTCATTVSCTRQTLFQKGIIFRHNIKRNNRSFYSILNYSLLPDPSLLRISPWSIPYSLIIYWSITPLVTSIAHSSAPWSIACFLSFDFSAFYNNRSFYCSPILRLLPDP